MPSPSKTKDCPLCGRPPSADDAPFCSRGCKDRDLLQWLGEGYRIPGPRTTAAGQSEEDEGFTD